MSTTEPLSAQLISPVPKPRDQAFCRSRACPARNNPNRPRPNDYERIGEVLLRQQSEAFARRSLTELFVQAHEANLIRMIFAYQER